jgi:hypothetical protein
MYSEKANSTLVSVVYEQDANESNWTEMQASIKNISDLDVFPLVSNSTSMVFGNRMDAVSEGTSIYVSDDNGSTVIETQVGGVNTGSFSISSNATFNNLISYSEFGISNSITSTAVTVTIPAKCNYDGTLIWTLGADGNSIVEIALTEAGNVETAYLTGRSLGSTGINCAFDFSHDGHYLFIANSTTLQRFTLGTPFDLTSRIANSAVTRAGVFPATIRRLFVSSYGTKIVFAGSHNAEVRSYTLSRPYDIHSAVSDGGNLNILNLTTTSCSLSITPDGKTWVAPVIQIGTGGFYRINVGNAGTPWQQNTVSHSFQLLSTNAFSANTNTTYYPNMVLSGSGKYLYILPPKVNSPTYLRMSCIDLQGARLSLGRRADISGANLANTPTHAWLSPPNLYIDYATSTNNVIVQKRQIHMSSSNTTSVTVGSEYANLFSNGDTILLNNSVDVTITGITESANSLAAQSIAGTEDYLIWESKTFNTGVNVANGCLEFSRDGRYMYVAGNTTGGAAYKGLYQYYLNEPWDVTTAVYNDVHYLNQIAGIFPVGDGNMHPCSISMRPDGKRAIVAFLRNDQNGTGPYLYQYDMTNSHDISTAHYTTNVYLSTFYNGVNTNYPFRNFKISPNGSSIIAYSPYVSASNPGVIKIGSLTSPWDVSSGSSLGVTYSTSSTYPGSPHDTCFSANGTVAYMLNPGAYFNTHTNHAYVHAVNANVAFDFSTITEFPSGVNSGNTSIATDWPAGSIGVSGTPLRSMYVAPTGDFVYFCTSGGLVYQFGCRTKDLNEYDITFVTQNTAPTSVHMPQPSLTSFQTTHSNGTLIHTSNSQGINARAIQFKLSNSIKGSEISEVRIDLSRES